SVGAFFATDARSRLRRSSSFPSGLRRYRSDHSTSSAFLAVRISAAVGSGCSGSGTSGTAVFFAFFAGLASAFGSFSSAMSRLPGLLRDINPVLENPRVESANSGGLLDVRGRLTDRLDVRAAEEDLVALHLDLCVPEDPRLARELLAEEVFDDEFGAPHGGLQREVAVDDLHLVREALSDPDDHVPQVGREGTDEGRLLPPRVLAANRGLLAFHIDAQPRVEQAAPKRVTAPGHDDEVTVDPELDSVRDLDGLFQ